MKISPLVSLALLALAATAARAADRLTVTVTHDLSIARPAETISVPWSEIIKIYPDALLQHLEVKDAAGHVLPYQVTNLKPLDSKGAYGELLFQHDFAAGEKSASFTVDKIEAVAPPFPIKAFARYVPERLDDFAWENDKVGHRTYGPALGLPDDLKTGKEVLVTNGLDVWCKRVSYPIVDRWYNKGHNHYHKDEGEGMDMYQVGKSRGCGGTGVWDGKTLYVGRNYKAWKILANGPIRSIFELSYDPIDVNGAKVSEVKRFTVDAGHNFDQMDSTFTVEGDLKDLTIAIGLNKTPADKNQETKIEVIQNPADGSLAQWVVQSTNGSLGTAIIIPSASASFAEDALNQLVVAKATPGEPLRYHVGAGWSKAGEFTSKEAWTTYIAACAARAKSPVKVSVAAK